MTTLFDAPVVPDDVLSSPTMLDSAEFDGTMMASCILRCMVILALSKWIRFRRSRSTTSFQEPGLFLLEQWVATFAAPFVRTGGFLKWFHPIRRSAVAFFRS